MSNNKTKMMASLSKQMKNSSGGGTRVAEALNEENQLVETVETINNLPINTVKLAQCYSAPKQWNFYDPVSKEKKIEMVDSLMEDGLYEPISIWKINKEDVKEFYTTEELNNDTYGFVGSEYMVLAGHNRADAHNIAFHITNDPKFLDIDVKIFKEEKESFLKKAQNIIVNTNYLKRDPSTREKQLEIVFKCKQYENDGYQLSKRVDKVAEELHVTPRTIYNRIKIEKLIDDIKLLFYDNKLSMKICLSLADLSDETQRYIFDRYFNILADQTVNNIFLKIKPHMENRQIDLILENDKIEKHYATITFKVPNNLKKSIEEKIRDLIKQELDKSSSSPYGQS